MPEYKDLYRQIGELIRARREDAGITQDTLGERLGMTRTSVTNFENARQRVQLDTLYQTAEVLGVPVSALLPPEIEGESVKIPQARLKGLPTTVREWIREVMVRPRQRVGEEYLEWIRERAKAPTPPPLMHLCDSIYGFGEVTDMPVPIEKAARAIGVEVRYGPCKGEVSTAIFRSKDAALIAINSLQPIVRQRFAIAHALAHLILHDHNFHIDFGFSESSKEECEANNLAVELLVPGGVLENDLRGKMLDFEDDERVRELAERYKVSLQVMNARLFPEKHRFPEVV